MWHSIPLRYEREDIGDVECSKKIYIHCKCPRRLVPFCKRHGCVLCYTCEYRVCTRMYLYVQVCTGTYPCIQAHNCMYRYIRVHTGMYRYVQIHTGMYRYIWVYTGMYEYVPVHTCMYRYIPVHTRIYTQKQKYEICLKSGSNQRPLACQTDGLTATLPAHREDIG